MTSDHTTSLPVGFSECHCFEVSCRTCNESFGEDTTLHFKSVDEAIKCLLEQGWWYTQAGVQCGSCAAKEACATNGCAWDDWELCLCDGRIKSHVVQMESRHCASCDAPEWRPTVRS